MTFFVFFPSFSRKRKSLAVVSMTMRFDCRSTSSSADQLLLARVAANRPGPFTSAIAPISLIIRIASLLLVLFRSRALASSHDPVEHRNLQFLSSSQPYCPLSDTTYHFRYNATSGLWKYSTSITGAGSANRHDSAGHANHTHVRFLPAASAGLALPVVADGSVATFRSCSCVVPTVFCDAIFDSCQVNGDGSVLCFNDSALDTAAQSFWTIALFAVPVLLCVLACTPFGVAAQKYVRRQVGWICSTQTSNDFLRADLDELLQKQPARAALLYKTAVARARRAAAARAPTGAAPPTGFICFWTRRRRQQTEDLEVARMDYDPVLDGVCKTLTLKTKTIRLENANGASKVQTQGSVDLDKSGSSLSLWLPEMFRRESVTESITLEEMDEEMGNGGRCAICLARLVVGDVVGDIACGHVFHKDCLKDWLTRQNDCPMCRHPDIAEVGQKRPSDVKKDVTVVE